MAHSRGQGNIFFVDVAPKEAYSEKYPYGSVKMKS